MDLMKFKRVLNRIIAENSDFETIEDLNHGEDLTIDCPSRGSLPLTIERSDSSFVVARYTSRPKGNARLKFIFDNPQNLQPIYMEDPFTNIYEQEEIEDFLCNTWKEVLVEDYLTTSEN